MSNIPRLCLSQQWDTEQLLLSPLCVHFSAYIANNFNIRYQLPINVVGGWRRNTPRKPNGESRPGSPLKPHNMVGFCMVGWWRLVRRHTGGQSSLPPALSFLILNLMSPGISQQAVAVIVTWSIPVGVAESSPKLLGCLILVRWTFWSLGKCFTNPNIQREIVFSQN